MKKVVVGLVAIGLVLGGASVVQQSQADCVNLYIDYGPLNNGAKVETCLPVTGEVNALDFLASANLVTEGTQQYGEAVLCRLNGFPDASQESCEGMPPAEAYWAVIIKERQLLPLPFSFGNEWGWAQTGINEVYLNAGDSIGFVFADNGEVRFP